MIKNIELTISEIAEIHEILCAERLLIDDELRALRNELLCEYYTDDVDEYCVDSLESEIEVLETRLCIINSTTKKLKNIL